MRLWFCFGIGVAAASAAAPASRMTLVVRSEAQTGRLVRSVTVEPRVISPATPSPVSSALSPIDELVARLAERHEIDPDLVRAVIRTESNFNPLAVSPKGARGLMQLIPETARQLGVRNSFNPEQNIDGGVRHLKRLIAQYNGDYRLALAAYNAGEGAVARYGGIPPYPETRSYVYQVGKRLGDAKRAAPKKPAPAKSDAREHPVIEQTIDAEGRVFYRTRNLP